MKYTVALPTDRVDLPAEFGGVREIAEMAAAAEAAGFDACHVTDHPFPPGPWVRNGGHHTLDPLITLSVASTATSRLRLHTNVLVPAYRNPFLAAKSISTLDALTGGRVILGVAAGYLEPEFAALGVPFEGRGALLDTALALMKQAWTGERVEAEGPGWSARGNEMRPRPATVPHPPIWIGGNSRAARRRAVTAGQGWAPFPASGGLARAVRTSALRDLADLRRALADLRDLAEQQGRTEPLDICLTPFSHPHGRDRFDPEVLLAEAAELAGAGVTWLSVALPAPSRAAFLENLERFGAEVITVAV